MTSTCTQQTAHHEKLVLSITNVFENSHHAHKCILFPILEEKEPVTQTSDESGLAALPCATAAVQDKAEKLNSKHQINWRTGYDTTVTTLCTGTVDADTPVSRF